MAFLQVSVFSEALRQTVAFNAILPQNRGDDTSVLYLLHGLSDDHTIWCRRTSIERYADGLDLAVIMPSTNRGFYTDMAAGQAYWTYVAEELPAICRGLFHITERREKTFAAGLSMGGYGALKLGLRKPDSFAAVASLSGAVDMASRLDAKRGGTADEAWAKEMRSIFGDAMRPEDDLFILAERLSAQGSAPKLWMCCGTSDYLIEANLRFHRHLSDLGLEHTYIETPGRVHSWDYWDEKIPDVLRWLPVGG